jgi:bifunctional DNA-binding transcriptional regulator/antitoxin component of YhaV-PrlF toxin-antitoxin module
MTKVTPDLRVPIPRNLASKYGIHPGDDVRFVRTHGALRIEIRPRSATTSHLTPRERMRFFEAALARERLRTARR